MSNKPEWRTPPRRIYSDLDAANRAPRAHWLDASRAWRIVCYVALAVFVAMLARCVIGA